MSESKWIVLINKHTAMHRRLAHSSAPGLDTERSEASSSACTAENVDASDLAEFVRAGQRHSWHINRMWHAFTLGMTGRDPRSFDAALLLNFLHQAASKGVQRMQWMNNFSELLDAHNVQCENIR